MSRSCVKAILERLALSGGPASIARARKRGDCLVLAFHNIVPDKMEAAGERALHLPRTAFAQFLDVLAKYCEVVGLDHFLSSSAEGITYSGRPRVVITFDDAYIGALTHGLEELTLRGMPATYFVAPGCIGGKTFWWDEVAEKTQGVLPAELRHQALTTFRGIGERVREATGTTCCDLPDVLGAAGEELLSTAAEWPGITFGSHTWGHPNLCALNTDMLRRELTHSLTWLLERYSNARPWLSYPYGLFDETVRQAAQDAGYSATFAISGGWIRGGRSSQAFDVPRLNVPAGLTPNGLALRVSGL